MSRFSYWYIAITILPQVNASLFCRPLVTGALQLLNDKDNSSVIVELLSLVHYNWYTTRSITLSQSTFSHCYIIIIILIHINVSQGRYVCHCRVLVIGTLQLLDNKINTSVIVDFQSRVHYKYWIIRSIHVIVDF